MTLSPAEIAGLSGGAVVVVGAGIWLAFASRRRRRRRRVDVGLSDPNPSTRLAALDLLAERGPSGHLATLVDRVLIEDDPDVRAALAGAVVRMQWDAKADRRLLLLRTWAARVVPGATTPPPEVGTPSTHELEEAPSAVESGGERVDRPEVGPALPSGRVAESEYETLRENEQQVMDWLFSPEPAAGSARTGAGRARDPWPVGGDRSAAFAKAEERAIDLLRAAGYGVTPGRVLDARDDASTAETGRSAAEEARLLRQLGAEQAVRLSLLEQMIRRAQAENARLEAELGRLSQQPEG